MPKEKSSPTFKETPVDLEIDYSAFPFLRYICVMTPPPVQEASNKFKQLKYEQPWNAKLQKQ